MQNPDPIIPLTHTAINSVTELAAMAEDLRCANTALGSRMDYIEKELSNVKKELQRTRQLLYDKTQELGS